jgi:hypothetical protein
MVTKAEFEAVAPDAFKTAKAAEAKRPLEVNSTVVWIRPDGHLGGMMMVNGGAHRVVASAFIIKELDERTALIEGLMEGQDMPAVLRVNRNEITHVEPFYETLFRTMHALGILEEDEDMPKH